MPLLFFMACKMSQTQVVEDDLNVYGVKEGIDMIYPDKLNNLYILTKKNRILRYDSDMNFKYEYTNSNAGDISLIDARNPQKILAFAKDFNRIYVLDNTLAEITTIDLSQSNFYDISTIGGSNDNLIWLFDPVQQKLLKIDDEARIQYESNRMSDYNLADLEPVKIHENTNKVIMSDPNKGLFVFDNFGHYLTQIDVKDVYEFQFIDSKIYYCKEGKMVGYDLRQFQNFALPDSTGRGCYKWMNQKIYPY